MTSEFYCSNKLLAAYEKRFNAISCAVCRFPINYDIDPVQPPLHNERKVKEMR